VRGNPSSTNRDAHPADRDAPHQIRS
jgi:hypothetical protein